MAKKRSSQPLVSRENWKWLVGGLIIILLVFVVSYYSFQSLSKVKYQGLVFTKEAYGDLIMYHYYYYVKDQEGSLYKSNIYLRHDPRKNIISQEGTIQYPAGKYVLITVNTEGISECSDSVLAVSTLSSFMANNLLPARGGTPDAGQAAKNNARHVTCEMYPNNTVILIQRGNETSIRQQNNCHTIRVRQCEDLLPAVEKFMVESILDAKEAAEARDSSFAQ